MPRATTAAWLVLPPVEVSIPWEASMPAMSSGLVSCLTRMTFSPPRLQASASFALKTMRPTAAPGEALSPLVMDRASLSAQVSIMGWRS